MPAIRLARSFSRRIRATLSEAAKRGDVLNPALALAGILALAGVARGLAGTLTFAGIDALAVRFVLSEGRTAWSLRGRDRCCEGAGGKNRRSNH